MIKTIGNLTLPDGLEWTDRFDWQPVSQEAVRTLSGGQVMFCSLLSQGRPITLDAHDGSAWLDQITVDLLYAMASQVGAVFQFYWGSEIYSVMFRHEDKPALEVKPLVPHYNIYTGTIKLVTV
jgi:hypothetical protein